MFFDSGCRGHMSGAVFAPVALRGRALGGGSPRRRSLETCAGALAPRLIRAAASCDSRVLSDAEHWSFHCVPLLSIREGCPPPCQTCLEGFFFLLLLQYSAKFPLAVFEVSGHCWTPPACRQPAPPAPEIDVGMLKSALHLHLTGVFGFWCWFLHLLLVRLLLSNNRDAEHLTGRYFDYIAFFIFYGF